MARKLVCFIVALSLATPLVWLPPKANACGWLRDEPVFTIQKRPEEIATFAQGKLGIVLPSFQRIYLVAAYRSLSGIPLTTQEQKTVVNFWYDPDFQKLTRRGSDGPPEWLRTWLETRAHVVHGDEQTSSFFRAYGISVWDGDHAYYNCLPDAFLAAASTLRARLQQFGDSSPAVKDWVAAQDQVFANCGDSFLKKLAREPYVPGDVGLEAPPLLRADRSYQIAAAHFYSGHFTESAERFSSIAEDARSPWQSIAPYLAARAFLREATTNSEGNAYDTKDYERAEELFHKVLADPSRERWHEPSRRLINYIELRLRPDQRQHELASALRGADSLHFEQNLRDLNFLLDNHGFEFKGGAGDDLIDWIATFQSENAESEVHATVCWQNSHSIPWLAAALTHAHPNTPAVGELLAGALKVPQNSPAFALARFHRARLLVESGSPTEARKEIDSFLQQKTEILPASSLNLWLSLRLPLARTFDEFLHYSIRMPAAVYGGGGDLGPDLSPWKDTQYAHDPKLATGMLSQEARAILQTQASLRVLVRTSSSKELPISVREQLAQATWVRAVLLEDSEALAAITPVLIKLVPQLRKSLVAVLAASSGDERKFVAASVILKFPGFSPEVANPLPSRGELGALDHYHLNWWPEQESSKQQTGPWIPYGWGGINSSDLLPNSDAATVAKEWQQLSRIPAGPTYLSSAVLAWAKSHPKDARVPEALHLAVRSTRWGQEDQQNSNMSRTAFLFLHKHYPNSEWTRKTPYWF